MHDALMTRMVTELWRDEEPGSDEEIASIDSSAGEPTHKFIKHASSQTLEDTPSDKLLKALELQVSKLKDTRERYAGYDGPRRLYNTVACELNRRGSVAPCFRPRLRPKTHKARFRTDLDNLHSNDLQVLDMHWLFSRGFDSYRCGETYRPIFKAENIDDFFQKAEAGAACGWRMKEKCSALGLSLGEEWLLAVIRAPKIRKTFGELSKSSMHFRRMMEDDMYSQRFIRKNLSEWPKLWLARQIAGQMHGMKEVRTGDKVSATRIAEVFSMMDGKPRKRQVIAKRVERLLRYCRDIGI